jgi:hypothetical protein
MRIINCLTLPDRCDRKRARSQAHNHRKARDQPSHTPINATHPAAAPIPLAPHPSQRAPFAPARTRKGVRREIQLMLKANANRAPEAQHETPPPPSTTPAPAQAAGEPIELGRYTTRAGEQRVLYAIPQAGHHIVDACAEGPGQMYTIQQDLASSHHDGEPQTVVAAYIAEAERLGRIPLGT